MSDNGTNSPEVALTSLNTTATSTTSPATHVRLETRSGSSFFDVVSPRPGANIPSHSDQATNPNNDPHENETTPIINLSTTRTASHIQLKSKLHVVQQLNNPRADLRTSLQVHNDAYITPDEGEMDTYIHQDDYDLIEAFHERPMTQAEYLDLTKKKESSVEFHPNINNLYVIEQYAKTRRQRCCDHTFRWIATLLVALLIGLFGAAIRIANARVNTYKFLYVQEQLDDGLHIGAWGVYISWSLLMLFCSSFIVLCIEMKANGSGIPDVKASLNGMNMPGVFTFKTLVAKLFASGFLINASVPTGVQGPVLFLGAVAGGWFPSLFKWLIKRVFCCANEHEEIRDIEDVPLRPNPISALTYTQGYYQQVYANAYGVDSTALSSSNSLTEYSANDLFLQDVGVTLSSQGPSNNGNNQNNQTPLLHHKQYPARTDINADDKPSLKDASDRYIDPEIVANLTIDDDIVPVTNTGRRFFAQAGVIIETQPGVAEDTSDYIKPVQNPKHFGENVNANGGIVGIVVRNRRVHVEVNQENQSLTLDDAALSRATDIDGRIYDLNDAEAQSCGAKCCPRWLRKIDVPSLNNDSDRRDFISIGSAAGVAAAMGSALGGFAFALEEMATHWRPDLSLRVLAAATLSYLCASFFAQGNLNLWGIFNAGSNTFFVGRRNIPFFIEEIPVFILLGIVCGVVGALYTFTTINIMRWRNKFMANFKPTNVLPRFADTLFIAAVYITLCYVLPMAWPCEAITPDYAAAQALSGGASAGTYTTTPFDCPAGFQNRMAGLSLQRADIVIKRLLAKGIPNNFELPELLVWSMLYFIFCAILQQTNASWGVILPLMMVGSSWGRLFGKCAYELFGGETLRGGVLSTYFDPGVYASVATSAIFASTTRSILGMTVVVLEMKSDISLIVPVLIGTFVSHIVGQLFTPSLFIAIINERKLPYLNTDPPEELNKLTTKQIMLPEPIILGSCEKVSHILSILETSHHSGYPVVIEPCTATYAGGIDSACHKGHNCDKNFLGTIHRKHLLILLNRRVWRATSTPFTVEDFKRVNERSSPRLPELRARLTSQDLDSCLDIIPWINRSSLLVTEATNAAQAFYLFRYMGLRHLPVINSRKHLVGIVTRLELLEPVVKHRYSELRRAEYERVKNGTGISIAQDYVDSNTAKHIVHLQHTLEQERQKTKSANKHAFMATHGISQEESK